MAASAVALGAGIAGRTRSKKRKHAEQDCSPHGQPS
jgi:hypothetical protein